MTREELKKIAKRYAQDELKDNHSAVEDVVAAAFLNGIDYAEHHPHWISVDDELPKDSGDVLVLTKGGKMLVTLGTYDEGEWVWCFYSPKDYITHWMHLPQSPEP